MCLTTVFEKSPFLFGFLLGTLQQTGPFFLAQFIKCSQKSSFVKMIIDYGSDSFSFLAKILVDISIPARKPSCPTINAIQLCAIQVDPIDS